MEGPKVLERRGVESGEGAVVPIQWVWGYAPNKLSKMHN